MEIDPEELRRRRRQNLLKQCQEYINADEKQDLPTEKSKWGGRTISSGKNDSIDINIQDTKTSKIFERYKKSIDEDRIR